MVLAVYKSLQRKVVHKAAICLDLDQSLSHYLATSFVLASITQLQASQILKALWVCNALCQLQLHWKRKL